MKYKNIYIILIVVAAGLFSACDEFEDTDTVSPVVASNNEGVRFAGSNLSTINLLYSDLDFSLTVIRNNTSSAVTVPISAVGDHGDYFDLPENVVFPAGEDTVVFDLAVKESAPQGVNLNLQLVVDETFSNPYMAEYRFFKSTVFVKPPCQYNEITLEIVFDDYGSETSWEILDSEEEAVASGGPYSDGLATIAVDICLEDGDYTLVINDSYGDGITLPGGLTIGLDGVEILNVPGDFGSSTSESFTLGE
jgi:hypothetical protein